MTRSIRKPLKCAILIFAFCFFGAGAPPLHAVPSQPAAKNVCLDCHGLLDGKLQVLPDAYSRDIHVSKGLTCTSCHGGDSTDEGKAMEKSSGFRGSVPRGAVPALCGRCHSDGSYMRQFNPSLRTDQLAQYQTSVHGKRLATGNQKVAVCTDCHGVHGIRSIRETDSSVHPVNVAKTCSRCHSDHEYMKGYGIPVDQFAGYSKSVHQEALTVRGDLSAPTCTTCHGNHGAAPPGVASVENVCSNCHVLQAQLFDSSPHKAAFTSAGLSACVTCHSNHRITHPTDRLLGTGPESVCTNCHTRGEAGWQTASDMKASLESLQIKIKASDEILRRAEKSGMEISEAQLEQTQASDWLTKARVTVHTFDLRRMKEDLAAGEKITDKTLQAGKDAMRERDRRRIGLSVSVLAILAVLIGLRLWITTTESSER